LPSQNRILSSRELNGFVGEIHGGNPGASACKADGIGADAADFENLVVGPALELGKVGTCGLLHLTKNFMTDPGW